MRDLERLVSVMNFCGQAIDDEGLDTLYDLANGNLPASDRVHDVEAASEFAQMLLHTLFELQVDGPLIFGRPKVSLEGLMSDLVNLLERFENYLEWRESPSV